MNDYKLLAQAAKALFLKKEPFTKDYLKDYEELESMVKDSARLPSKIPLTEVKNLEYDKYRIEYIIKACDFLKKYCSTEHSEYVKEPRTDNEKIVAESLRLMNARQLLFNIGDTIFNISGSVRAKYKQLLGPAPFTWETFEQFGGLMKIAPPDYLYLPLRNMEAMVSKRLANEYRSSELIIEMAVPEIIKKDISTLKFLFWHIQRYETGIVTDHPSSPLEFISIKALTRRIIDTESLIELLKLTNNNFASFDHAKVVEKLKKLNHQGLSFLQFQDDDVRHKRVYNLNTTKGQHAALRRLERIGELITGKNLSSWIKKLDPSIDWEAITVIRDVIAHQDEGSKHFKVMKLLKNKDLFNKILGHDMQELFNQLKTTIVDRDKKLPTFTEDINQFWSDVYLYEKKQLHVEKNKQSQEKKKIQAIEYRTSQENINFIMSALRENKAPEEVLTQWKNLLEGKTDLPNKLQRGELMRNLPKIPVKDETLTLRMRWNLLKKQIFNLRTSLEERAMLRRQQQGDSVQRKLEKETGYSGLDNLRGLAKTWKTNIPGARTLKTLDRIILAIESLENIKKFMEDDIFIRANLNFSNLSDWEAVQKGSTATIFFAALLSDPELSQAIEYNAEQLLQNLDRLLDLPEAKICPFLDKDQSYDMLRYLRNWVAHGNQLQDREDYIPGQNPSPVSELQKKVGPIMVRLIFELLPTLYNLREIYDKKQYSKESICIAPFSSLFSSNWTNIEIGAETKDDCCGPGYGF